MFFSSSWAKMNTHWQSCSWYSKFCSSVTLLTQAGSQNSGGWRLFTAREGTNCGGRYFSKAVLLIYKEGAKFCTENPKKWAFPGSHNLCYSHVCQSSRALSFSQATHRPGPFFTALCSPHNPRTASPVVVEPCSACTALPPTANWSESLWLNRAKKSNFFFIWACSNNTIRRKAVLSPKAITPSVRKHYSLTEDALNLYRTSPFLKVFLMVAPKCSK